MKSINVPSISSISELDAMPWNAIDNNNWPEFAAAPDTKMKIAHLPDAIVVAYEVKESNPRAVNTNDMEPVYEDSCVEFFCQVPGDANYQNYEFNSNGRLLASKRLSRKDGVELRTPEQLAMVKRIVDVKPDSWTLIAEIPYALIGITPATKELKVNFYKCGDLTEHPHFASWNPIHVPAPDFHRPDFFGTATLA